MATHAQAGRVTWIGLRTARRGAVAPVEHVTVSETGLDGDRHARANGRAVTLIQAEHLPVIAALSGREGITPHMLRRNIVVAGINLTALKGTPFSIGTAVLEIAATCAPCSHMHQVLGPGGYNAMRGHGGWTARVLTPGQIAIGDAVAPLA